MTLSKISVNLNEKTFDIEVPDQNVKETLELLQSLFERFPSQQKPASSGEELKPSHLGDIAELNSDLGAGQKTKPKKRSGRSSSKSKAPSTVDLHLSEDQRRDIVEFFEQKDPANQSDQVAVLSYKLKEHMNKDNFSIDEIHSAFKIVKKPTPKSLAAVFGNMKRDGIADYSDSKIYANSYTDDHVNHHMGKKKEKKKKTG